TNSNPLLAGIQIEGHEDGGYLLRDTILNSERKNLVASNCAFPSALLLVICCLPLTGCRTRQADDVPYIEIIQVPRADAGGPEKLDVIEGRVVGVSTNLQMVLYARSGAWYVQPFADQPFTQIQDNSKWRSTTHLGTEYAALLVEPGYQPPAVTDALPGEGEGVIAVAHVRGVPVFWQRWWLLLLCA